MIKAVIFDMDGVLLDTEKYYVKYWMQAGQDMGFPFERQHACWFRSFAGKFAQNYAKLLFGDGFDYWKVRSHRKALMEPMTVKLPIEKKADVDEILDYLRSKGIMTAVATATDYERAGALLEHVGIRDKFDRVICVEMVPNGKPMSDIYRYASSQLGLKPWECIAVEDSPNGVTAACSAGCRTVMAVDLTEPDEVLELMLYGKVHRLGELKEMI